MERGNWVDDRPPKSDRGWVKEVNELTAKLLAKYPNPLCPITEIKMEELI
jgi:hypothetical protein